MQIHFEGIENTVIPHMRGGEGEVHARMHQDPDNKIMRLTLPPGASIGIHAHQDDSEIIYVLSGRGKVQFDGQWEPLSPGVCHYCPRGCAHTTVNDGTEDLVLFAVVGVHGGKG